MERLKNISIIRRPYPRNTSSLSITYSKSNLVASKIKITRVLLEPFKCIKPRIFYLKKNCDLLNKKPSHLHIKLSPIQGKKTYFIEKCDEEELRALL